MLGLGDFRMDGFEHHPEWAVVWVFFLAATFFTQVVFLNMLIAIMGNTFDFVIERKSMYALQTKLDILADYYWVIAERNPSQQNNIYLFVVRPKVDAENDDDEAWEGGFNYIRNLLTRETTQMQATFQQQLSVAATKLADQIEQVRLDLRQNI